MHNATRVFCLPNMLNNDDITVWELDKRVSVYRHERIEGSSGQRG